MPKIDPKAPKLIDAYISQVPDYAQPICRKVRRIIHKADKGIMEDWKWGPNFNKDGMLCGFGAFKEWVAVHFFKGALLKDPKKVLEKCPGTQHSRRLYLRSEKDVNEKVIVDLVRQAVKLNAKGIATRNKPIKVSVPTPLRKALAEKPRARKYFDSLAPGYRREYCEYIIEAKRLETREKRMVKVMQLIGAGKTLHDKYKK